MLPVDILAGQGRISVFHPSSVDILGVLLVFVVVQDIFLRSRSRAALPLNTRCFIPQAWALALPPRLSWEKINYTTLITDQKGRGGLVYLWSS